MSGNESRTTNYLGLAAACLAVTLPLGATLHASPADGERPKAPQSEAQPSQPTRTKVGDRRICRNIEPTASRIGSQRVCMTAREWRQLDR